jgi:uncharacterized protein
MVPINMLRVEVAYATPEKQTILTLEIATGATILEVILHSGITTLYTEIDLDKQKVGIFGKLRQLSDKVKEGDRIEIYRPLTLDPKEARRVKGRALKHKKP